MKILPKHIARFERHIGLMDSNGCRCWKNCKEGNYGSIRIGKSNVGAHRICWILNKGPIPKGKCVLHHCDNSRCVEITHLFLGTKGDNNKDRASKGRNNHVCGDNHPMRKNPTCVARGEKSGSAKLTNNDVLEIRQRLAMGEIQIEIAKCFGVAKSHITNIKNRKVWNHL